MKVQWQVSTSEYFDERLLEDLDRHSRRLRSMAIMHMQFVVKFGYSGSEERRTKIGKIVHSNFPDLLFRVEARRNTRCIAILLENMIRDFASKAGKDL